VIAADSPLRQLYNDALFQRFLCDVLEEKALYPYADPLSSINLHYAPHGQELGWHFDNSSFAITLLVQKPLAGGLFQYVKDLRDADAGEMNFAGVDAVLDERQPVDVLEIDAGDLVLFRGRNSLHRVTPTEGEVTRMLAVLAYNTQLGIALSETARMTFYGRL
ncbi:2OG-Fe(II) oxygenase, partial [Pantoea allii]